MASYSPLEQVRKTCELVVGQSKHVTISNEAITKFISDLSRESVVLPNWDFNECHFFGDAATLGPLTCQYIFVLDSLNFCFWPTESLEYDNLALALKNAIIQDPQVFDASRLARITTQEIASWLPDFTVPLLEERKDRLNELGIMLLENFGGLAFNMVQAASRSCVKLVSLILQHLPGFRDTALYRGRLVHFYKRAQILTGDVWAAYGRPVGVDNIFSFTDLDELTMFADYRVPQILRDQDILQYSSHLASLVDSKTEIMSGSEEETEIRAATVVAVEIMVKELKKIRNEKSLKSIEMDWLLWQRAEVIKDNLRPHHRTLSIYY